jgi:hypothetical protein
MNFLQKCNDQINNKFVFIIKIPLLGVTFMLKLKLYEIRYNR